MELSKLTENLQLFAASYSSRGYEKRFNFDEGTGNYELVLSKEAKSATIRDGYTNGMPSTKSRELTSFDLLFTIEGVVFLKYVSDYPLEEYGERLAEVFKIIDAFFEGIYTITNERYMVFWKKKYLNLKVGDHEEHLLETGRV